MITLKQIKQLIEESERPFALFDDDPDGFCSFLQIKRRYPRLKGMPVKGTPVVPREPFLSKIHNHLADIVIVLDKPEISEEFRQNANIPIIWIDHHPVPDHRGTKYFNPRMKKQDSIAPPVAYWIYKMLDSNQDLWIAEAGILGDKYKFIPKEFIRRYKHLLPDGKLEIDEILFNSKFGEIIRAFDFVLKGKTRDMKDSIKALTEIKEPEEILNRSTPQGKFIYERYQSLKKDYDKLLDQALHQKTKKEPFIFLYPDQKYSFTSPLSTHLVYLMGNEFFIIGRNKTKDGLAKLSIRSKTRDLLPIMKKSLNGINGRGGGHKHACGAQIDIAFLDAFIENFKHAIREKY